MKKSLLALAVFGAFASAASAQTNTTNTTVYGIIDLGLTRSSSNTAGTRVGLDSGNWYGSRLGFRGAEDLGGGLSAIFDLENGFSADTGSAAQGGRLFGRHAWVGLKGGFGTLRLGRSWMPTYSLLTDVIDPFEDGLAGAASAFFGRNIFTAIDIRMQNAVFYSNSLGGLRADVAYSLGEVAGNTSANSQISTAFTYATGPLKAVLGYHDVKDAAGTGSAKLTFVGGTYDFGPVKLHLGLDKQKTDAAGATTADANDVLVGVTVPVGAGRILASYNRLNDRTPTNADMKQYAVGYTYDMSKRTTLYTSYGHISLNDANRFNVGIRHKF
jgi:predicted porin